MAEDQQELSRGCQLTAVGCVTSVAGFFSGGMIAVLVSKFVAFLTRAPSCPDVPSCNWAEYMIVGAILGVVSLPTLALWRLRRSGAGVEPSDRG
ncbi:MAG TPA: hypothetical protein VFY16_03805 [Gemmatimonadaceae bacterium]|nr:hypothetical protein [Gemmatimonadaceae bacterium]